MKRFFIIALAVVGLMGSAPDVSAKKSRSSSKNSPTAIANYRQKLQGLYVAYDPIDESVIATEMGAYYIEGDKISGCHWDARTKKWVKDFTVPFTIKYIPNNYYMTGYNIIYSHPQGYVEKFCSGDTDGDGKMDLWQTDSMYYTKVR